MPQELPGAAKAVDYVRAQIDRTQTRSMVISSRGVVASEHPMASQAGAMILARGGHAVDAAIAANAVMGVVAPMMNGVGGDLFAIVHEAKGGQLHGVNASGWAPSGLSLEFLQSRGLGGMPASGIHSVTIPGAVAGWSLLRDRFGRKPFSEILSSAVRAADEGFPVSEIVAEEWAGGEALLRGDATASRTYLPGGKPPRVGDIFRNPALAWTYRQIAEHGRDAFYRGAVAGRVLACSKAHGGTIAAADLAEFDAAWVEPISVTYRGWNVYELPPNGQGIAALMMLNMLEQFPLRQYGHQSVEALHALIETKKLAYADMIRHVADPQFSDVPVAGMLSKAYARDRAALIDPERASGRALAGTIPTRGGDTTYLCAVDRDGNMVSLIQSIFGNFGSGLVPEGAGFALQSRGGLFTLDPAQPNALAPRKRPLHTIIPGFMSRADVRIAFGIMGGWNQSQAHAQFVSNVVDHDMNIQAALEAARFTKISFTGCDLLMEERIPERTRTGLARKGHQIDVQGAFSSMVGGGQSVMRDAASGVNYGGSDPRKDGAAIPEPFAD
jgi:gamma-glutamyltranspeptidase / glutathione hydrolase